jgi:hypothetical protein
MGGKVSEEEGKRRKERRERTHLRVLNIRVLRDAKDGNRHLHDDAFEDGGIEEADAGGEPAENARRLTRPLTLREKDEVST